MLRHSPPTVSQTFSETIATADIPTVPVLGILNIHMLLLHFKVIDLQNEKKRYKEA